MTSNWHKRPWINAESRSHMANNGETTIAILAGSGLCGYHDALLGGLSVTTTRNLMFCSLLPVQSLAHHKCWLGSFCWILGKLLELCRRTAALKVKYVNVRSPGGPVHSNVISTSLRSIQSRCNYCASVIRSHIHLCLQSVNGSIESPSFYPLRCSARLWMQHDWYWNELLRDGV